MESTGIIEITPILATRDTGSILLSPAEDILAAATGNPYHDKKGKFTTGGSGGGKNLASSSKGSWSTPENRPITVTKTGLLFKKETWETVTKNGDKISLQIPVTSSASKKLKTDLLNGLADARDSYPELKTGSIMLGNNNQTQKIFGPIGRDTHAWIHSTVPKSIFVNGDHPFNKTVEGWMMPNLQNKDMSMGRYVMTHEIGHQFHFQKAGGKSAIGLFENPAVKKHLSTYGKINHHEGYAETFAEWHTSQGKTKNPAAIAYARHEGWFGAENLSASIWLSEALKEDIQYSQGEIMYEFAIGTKDSKEVDPENLFKIPKDSTTIIDSFDGETPASFIGPEPEEATKAELEEAEKLVRKVWKELGLDYEADSLRATGVITISEASLETATPSIHLLPQELVDILTVASGNPFHDEKGRFTTGGSGGGRGTGGSIHRAASPIPEPGEFNPEVEKAIRAFGHKPEDYDAKGKPIPGTDSWRDAHGISKQVWDTRPMTRWTDSKDPLFDEVYKDFPPNQKRFAKKIAGQSSGFIMERKAVPGAVEAGFEPLTPQARPDIKIVTDGRTKAKAERELRGAIIRAETVNNPSFTGADVIAERQARVNRAKTEVTRIKTGQYEEITQKALDNKDLAQAKFDKAKKTGDPVKIDAAKKAFNEADWAAKDAKRVSKLLEKDPGRAIKIAEQEQDRAEKALGIAKADPEKAVKNVREYAADQIIVKQEKIQNVAVKYVFPPGEGSASRIEAHQDAQNLKNLTQGNGKVYFIMEGNIKADAALTQIKKEDPKAAVVSVPSVTAWPDKETNWVAKTYLQGRDVILVPDSDGVNNPAVTMQAVKLAGKLRSNGVDNVLVAAPPLVKIRGKLSVETLHYPTGAEDHRKGLDDHLGLGKGTLGDLTFSDTPLPKFNLTELSKANKIRRQSVPNSNKSLEAISALAGERGAGKISHKSIEQYSGLASSSVNDSVKQLEKMGLIKVHHIFDPKLLGQGRRVQVLEYDEIKRITKKAGAKMPNLDIKYVDDVNNHEISPIIEILDNKFITRTGPSYNLASKYKNLKTSKGTPKPGATGAIKPGRRTVQTAEGAKLYNLPIGSTIPEGVTADTTGAIALVTSTSEAEIATALGSWSNGYIRSELIEEG